MSGSIERPALLEEYHQIRKRGEFPTSLTVSGAIVGGLLVSRACSAVAGENVGLLSIIPLMIAGGTLGYWRDRRESRRRMREFLSEHPEIQEV